MIVLTETQAKLLSTILETNPEKVALRVQLGKNRGEVDFLIGNRLVIDERNRYVATLYGLLHLTTPYARDQILNVERRFEEMLVFYKERHGKSFGSKELATRFNQSHKSVETALMYLFGSFQVPASHSYNAESGYMGIELGEQILDYDTFADLVIKLDESNNVGKNGKKIANSKVTILDEVPRPPKERPAPVMGPFGADWKIIRSLSEGGQAWTHLIAKGKTTSVGKLLKNLDRKERFEAEVRALGRLKHRGIVRLEESNFEAARPYFVMEHCAGGDLHDNRYWEGDHAAIIRILIQVADALVYSHDNGVVHRDIKPSNILLRSDNSVVLADFGLCFDIEGGGERLTETAEAVGARFFMAPEMEGGRAEEVNPACDVYSLGKLIYWLFSGGRILTREEFGESNKNLMTICQDHGMGHVNALLEQTVIYSPASRITLSKLPAKIRELGRLLKGGFNSLSGGSVAHCRYCGVGTYGTLNHNAVINFGVEARGQADLRILVCSTCGNVQLFREDLRNG